MLCIEQRCHNYIQSDRLSLLCCTRHEQVWSLAQVEYLDLLGDCAAYGNWQFCLGLTESLVIEHTLQRHYGRFAIGHLNTHGIVQFYDSDSLGPERNAYVALYVLDGGHLYSGCRYDLVEGNCRTCNGCNVLNLDFEVLQGGTDSEDIVALFGLRYYELAGCIVLKQIQ